MLQLVGLFITSILRSIRQAEAYRTLSPSVPSLIQAAVVILITAFCTFAHPPTAIVVDQKGTVYFTDLETVWKLDTNGKLSIFRPGVSGRHVHELAIDKDGNLFGADFSYESQRWLSDVWKMTPDAKLTYLVEPTSNPPRGASLWLDALGNMYLVDQNNHTKKQTLLLRRTPDGQVSTLAGSGYGSRDGKGTAASFGSVGGMFITNDGTIYLTDGTAVRKVTSDGEVTTIAKDLTKRTAEDQPMLFGRNDGMLTGLTVDSNNNIYVADAGNQRLLMINSAGGVEVVYRGGQAYYPNGVATSSTGDLFVLEVGYKPPSTWLPARVRKISSTGQSSIVAVSGEIPMTNLATNEPQTFGKATFRKIMIPVYVFPLAGVFLVGITIGAWRVSRKLRRR